MPYLEPEPIYWPNGTGDEERVQASGTFYVRVLGYAGVANDYTIRR